MSRRAWLTALWCALAACVEPTPRAPPEVGAPVLEALPATTAFRTVTLGGSAEEGAVVRLYVDDACAGPVLREVTSAQLAAGVEVELVPRAVNVFTARAFSRAGARSACAAPVRVESTPLDPPPTPTLEAQALGPPGVPTGRFRLWGRVAVAPTVLVRLFRGPCAGTPLFVLTPEEYERGVQVTLPANTFSTFSAQSVDVTMARSACASLTLVPDDRPPSAAIVRVASPNPSSGGFIWVTVHDASEFAGATFFAGPRCHGPWSATCVHPSECLFWIGLGPEPVEWSVSVFDEAGNAACFEGTEVLVRDDGLGEQAPVLELLRISDFTPMMLAPRVQATSEYTFVRLFDAPGCEGAPWGQYGPQDAVRMLAVDPGTSWSANMARVEPDAGLAVGKCSNTVVVP